VLEFNVQYPSLLSSLYGSSKLTGPNQTVLDAQTRVCTGPTQSKPLDEKQAFKVFDTKAFNYDLAFFFILQFIQQLFTRQF